MISAETLLFRTGMLMLFLTSCGSWSFGKGADTASGRGNGGGDGVGGGQDTAGHRDENVVSIDSGDYRHSCALLEDGAVRCWGEAGIPYTFEDPEDTFRSIAVGAFHGCGITAGGELSCWGAEEYAPDPGDDVGPFVQVDTYSVTTCALDEAGNPSCWGPSAQGSASAPDMSFQDISAGTFYSCGVTSSGTVVCWGDAELSAEAEAVTTAYADSYLAVSVGPRHGCAIAEDRSGICWGSNEDGEAEAPEGPWSTLSAGGALQEVDLEGFHTCGVRTDGSAACWGSNRYHQLDIPVLDPSDSWAQLSAGGWFTCGVSKQTAQCWGLTEGGRTAIPDHFH